MNTTKYSSVGVVAPREFTGDDPRAYITMGVIFGFLLFIICISLISTLLRWKCYGGSARVAVVVTEPIRVVVVSSEVQRSDLYRVGSADSGTSDNNCR